MVEHLTQNTEQEKERTDKLLKQLQTECERLNEKDRYLSVFVEKVVPACTLSNQNILAALKETPASGSLPICDFTLESLCTAIINGRASSKKLVTYAEVRDTKTMHAIKFNLAALVLSYSRNACLVPPHTCMYPDNQQLFLVPQ